MHGRDDQLADFRDQLKKEIGLLEEGQDHLAAVFAELERLPPLVEKVKAAKGWTRFAAVVSTMMVSSNVQRANELIVQARETDDLEEERDLANKAREIVAEAIDLLEAALAIPQQA